VFSLGFDTRELTAEGVLSVDFGVGTSVDVLEPPLGIVWVVGEFERTSVGHLPVSNSRNDIDVLSVVT